jgi:uncharacterized LabA/DUF88 family protein
MEYSTDGIHPSRTFAFTGPSFLVELGLLFMARIFFFVDGFNLYHALNYFSGAPDRNRYRKYKWLSLAKLAECFARKADKIVGIEYFTTLATWDPAKVARHRVFIKAQISEGVSVVYGEFKLRDKRCRLCGRVYQAHEEKQTDVNIAVRLLQLAFQDQYDKAVIVSGDTDLLPALKAVQRVFPGKEVGVVIPIGKASEDLKKQASFHYKMKEQHLISSQLPDTVVLSDGSLLHRPSTWK